MTLATTADVEAILQVDIQPDDDPKVVRLLEMADELLTDELGRSPIGETDVVETITVTGSRASGLLLSRWPVESITSVEVDGEALVDPDDYSAGLHRGILTRALGYYWPYLDPAVVVTYSPATIPGFRTLAASMVARAVRAGNAYAATLEAGLAGFKSLTVGRWNASTDTPSTGLQAAGEALYLTDTERDTVASWQDRLP